MTFYSPDLWRKSYDPDIPIHLEYPKKDLARLLDESLQKYSQRIALDFMGTKISFGKLRELIGRFGSMLLSHGLNQADRIAIQLPNIPQYLIAHYGAIRVGCVPVGCNPIYKPRELNHLLRDSGAKAIVTMDTLLGNLEEAAQGTQLELAIYTNVGEFLPRFLRLLGRLLRRIPAPPSKLPSIPGIKFLKFSEISRYPPDPAWASLDAESSPALMFYTGGTTGVPKGCVLSHRNLVSNAFQCRTWLHLGEEPRVELSAFPFFHAAGMIFGMMCLMQGYTQILIPDPRNTDFILKMIAKHRPHGVTFVPTIYIRLLNHPKFRKLDFSRTEYALSGAAPLPAEILNQWESSTGVPLIEVYGLTEASPVVTINPQHGLRKPGSVGLPLPDTMVKIVDPSDPSKELPLGEVGEILVKGPQVFYLGYWNNPQESSKTILEDGWIRTGDLGKMDPDGYLYIVDRTKDMINVKGYKVYSREVDDVLHQHPAVALAGTIGIPDPNYPGSELVKAYVVLKPGYSPSEELKNQIIQFARERLAPYKVPREIEFRSELPVSLIGKVLKKELRKEVEQGG